MGESKGGALAEKEGVEMKQLSLSGQKKID